MEEMEMFEVETATAEDEMNFDTESGNAGLVIAIGGAVVAGAAALAYSQRKKIEDWRVKRLEKKGYIVTKVEAEETEEEPKPKRRSRKKKIENESEE